MRETVNDLRECLELSKKLRKTLFPILQPHMPVAPEILPLGRSAVAGMASRLKKELRIMIALVEHKHDPQILSKENYELSG